MENLQRWLLTGLAAVSLVLAIYTGTAWASRLLPDKLPVYLSLVNNPQHKVYVLGGYNYIYFISSHTTGHAIAGPRWSDCMACSAFMNSFPSTHHGYRSLAIGWGEFPSFNQFSRSERMVMDGRESRAEIGFGYFPAIFLAISIGPWLPTILRRFKSKQITCPHCGANMKRDR
jgi:hypothetical protein